jgi:hypothetical protein
MSAGRTSRLKRFLSIPKYLGASRKRINRGATAYAEGSASRPMLELSRETELGDAHDTASVTFVLNAEMASCSFICPLVDTLFGLSAPASVARSADANDF